VAANLNFQTTKLVPKKHT